MKIVLFTCRTEYIKDYREQRDAVDQRVPIFLDICGYFPIAVPNMPELAKKMVNEFNPVGIVLTGGNSLIKYGGDAINRDETEKELLDLAIKNDIPVFGFCRGMQMILDYFGEELTIVTNHVALRHNIIGMSDIKEVNSYHNLGCMEISKNSKIEILARSEDGVIEAIKHLDYRIFATMWHPEREEPFKESDVKIVKDLFK